ncbi:hypothetical protein [Rhodococcus sp. IEGM 1379]|uniref:hypothetical protein n=1 Tax=Rhodococcus sp. IEGM 1379 TaxID=3047086 RepID=UPI0024B7AE86|nr:hypothetical protein [Rhodococcus sp. IEGM 1379]MDI9915470.1 hypothetical protein [Rhodococcus sp. IEGM 1379]
MERSLFRSVCSKQALVDGGSGVSGALAHSSLPFALMRGAWSVAGAGHGWATAKLDPGEAALVATESVARTTALWACSMVGLTVIPVPAAGAMIGGLVGQFGATMMVQGVRLAVTARDDQEKWDLAYGLLLDQTEVIKNQTFEELKQLETISAEYRTDFTTNVLPALERLQCGFWTEVPEQVLGDLAALTVTYAGTPLVTTLAEFDTFMGSSENVLTLKLK